MLAGMACWTLLFGNKRVFNVTLAIERLAFDIPTIVLWALGAAFLSRDRSRFQEFMGQCVICRWWHLTHSVLRRRELVVAIEAIAWTLCAMYVLHVLVIAAGLAYVCLEWDEKEPIPNIQEESKRDEHD